MSPLRQRTLEELQRRTYSPSTARGYTLEAMNTVEQVFRSGISIRNSASIP